MVFWWAAPASTTTVLPLLYLNRSVGKERREQYRKTMDNRVFDVSRPHHTKPDPTGRPVIIGHHPEMVDPMVRERAPEKPAEPEHHLGPPKPTDIPPVDNSPVSAEAPLAPHSNSF